MYQKRVSGSLSEWRLEAAVKLLWYVGCSQNHNLSQALKGLTISCLQTGSQRNKASQSMMSGNSDYCAQIAHVKWKRGAQAHNSAIRQWFHMLQGHGDPHEPLSGIGEGCPRNIRPTSAAEKVSSVFHLNFYFLKDFCKSEHGSWLLKFQYIPLQKNEISSILPCYNLSSVSIHPEWSQIHASPWLFLMAHKASVYSVHNKSFPTSLYI